MAAQGGWSNSSGRRATCVTCAQAGYLCMTWCPLAGLTASSTSQAPQMSANSLLVCRAVVELSQQLQHNSPLPLPAPGAESHVLANDWERTWRRKAVGLLNDALECLLSVRAYQPGQTGTADSTGPFEKLGLEEGPCCCFQCVLLASTGQPSACCASAACTPCCAGQPNTQQAGEWPYQF